MILFDDVSKKFGPKVTAIENISFKIEDGEFVFLVGPSVAGKTTILRCINKEISPSSGSVLVDDWEVSRLPDKLVPFLRRKVGFVFQDFKLLHDRTALENIAVS